MLSILILSITVYLYSFSIKKQNMPVDNFSTPQILKKVSLSTSVVTNSIDSTETSQIDVSYSTDTMCNKTPQDKPAKNRTNLFHRSKVLSSNVDTVYTLINKAMKEYSQNNYQISLNLYQMARRINHPDVDKSEIMKICIKGEADCLKKLRRIYISNNHF